MAVISCCASLSAQHYTIKLQHPDSRIVHQWLREQPRQQDSVSWIIARNYLLQSLHSEGYLLAAIPQWDFKADTLHAVVNPGNLIHWAQLSFRGIEFLPPQWVKELDVSGKVIEYDQWKASVRRVLAEAQAEGYLFAKYRIDIKQLRNDSIDAEIIFDPGYKIILDTIEIEGNARLSENFLQKTLGIRKGDPITPGQIELLYQQLGNLRFVQQSSPPVLILFQDKATIRTYLINRNASSFDILAGLQPATTAQSNITLTGYVELDLINQLTRGERIYLHLEKLRPRSQELEITMSYPYLLDLPFGVEGAFTLQKNDTLYSELKWKAGIFLPFGKNQYLRAGLTQSATNIISIDRTRIIATKRLPPYIDLRVNGLTLGIIRNRLDYDINPRKGYAFSLDGSVSRRRIRENDLILNLSQVDTSFNYGTLYDTLKDQSSRVALEGIFEYFIPWGSRSTIRLAMEAGALNSSDFLFSNEMFRLGGYERLRGFDEESILAQYYSIFTAEYRLIISDAGYISLFGDYAWISNEDVQSPFEDRPFGFGFGLTFETKAGIFGMRAAVGAQRGNPIDFGDARIHIGYANRF